MQGGRGRGVAPGRDRFPGRIGYIGCDGLSLERRKGEAMFVTMVEGGVDDAREGDLRSAWDERTSGDLPTGLVESYLMRADDGVWRIVTLWESKDVVMAMRATVEKPTAVLIFERAGSRPSVSMWSVEGRAGRGTTRHRGARAGRRADGIAPNS